MKLRTNLRDEELDLLAKAISKQVKSSRAKKSIVTENSAEKDLLNKVDGSFDFMLVNLKEELEGLIE